MRKWQTGTGALSASLAIGLSGGAAWLRSRHEDAQITVVGAARKEPGMRFIKMIVTAVAATRLRASVGSALGSLMEVAPGCGAQWTWIASLPWVWVPASAVSASGACARW
jgi:hypothetical protein